MNKDVVQGEWKEMRGQVKEAFGKLTDDDLMVAKGNAEQLTGAIQKRYGYTREQAQTAWTSFADRTASATATAKANTVDAVRGAAANGTAAVNGAMAKATDAIDPPKTKHDPRH